MQRAEEDGDESTIFRRGDAISENESVIIRRENVDDDESEIIRDDDISENTSIQRGDISMMSGNTEFKKLGDDLSVYSETEIARGGSVYNGSKISDTSFNRVDAVSYMDD